jgi:hypothetical protein
MLLSLSSRGLKNAQGWERDFIFDFNGEELRVPTFTAIFISPAVSRQLLSDPTLRTFKISTAGGSKFLNALLSLCSGETISVDKSDVLGFVTGRRIDGRPWSLYQPIHLEYPRTSHSTPCLRPCAPSNRQTLAHCK